MTTNGAPDVTCLTRQQTRPSLKFMLLRWSTFIDVYALEGIHLHLCLCSWGDSPWRRRLLMDESEEARSTRSDEIDQWAYEHAVHAYKAMNSTDPEARWMYQVTVLSFTSSTSSIHHHYLYVRHVTRKATISSNWLSPIEENRSPANCHEAVPLKILKQAHT